VPSALTGSEPQEEREDTPDQEAKDEGRAPEQARGEPGSSEESQRHEKGQE